MHKYQLNHELTWKEWAFLVSMSDKQQPNKEEEEVQINTHSKNALNPSLFVQHNVLRRVHFVDPPFLLIDAIFMHI